MQQKNGLKKWSLGLAMMVSLPVMADTANIKKHLAKMIPDAEQAVIVETPIKGLYQVTVDTQVVYMSEDGGYLLSGSFINLTTRKNLTELAKTAAYKKVMADFDEKSMIVYPAKGIVKHQVTIFTDIDCPYCTKLHHEVPALNEAGVSVRYMSYPRAGVGSASYNKAVSVWCSDKPTEVMDDAMNKLPVPSKTCANPVASHLSQVQRLGLNGTPAILLESGELLPGYVPANELIKLLNKPS